MEPLPALSVIERRILGVLVEKAKTTPDVYPLSINSIVTGSNQKSNRDPLLNLSDLEVEDAKVGRRQRWQEPVFHYAAGFQVDKQLGSR